MRQREEQEDQFQLWLDKDQDTYYHVTSKKALEGIKERGYIRGPVYVSEGRSRQFRAIGGSVLLKLDLARVDMEVDDDPKALYGWWKTSKDVPVSRILEVRDLER